MGKKKTTEEFKQEVREKVGDEYTVLGEYKNCHTKILMIHNCVDCNNYEYEVEPNRFLCGDRCPKCFGTPKKTTEEFKQEVREKVGDEYTVLGEYKTNKTKIKMRHNNCGYEYDIKPNDFLFGYKCPKCSNKTMKTTEKFKQEVREKVGDEYTVLGEYTGKNNKLKIRHNCVDCNNYEYEVAPNNFLKGTRCPKCNKNKNKKTTEEFKQEVREKVGDEYTVLGEYKDCHTKIKIRHNCIDCNNYEYEVEPNDFTIKGNRCPECNRLGNNYKGPNKIKEFLDINNINYVCEKIFKTCKYKKELPFDFYIEEKNILIEFDGKQHFNKECTFGSNNSEEDFKLQIKRDNIKNKWCKDNSITLIRISYKELDNLNNILVETLLKGNLNIKYNNIYIINEGQEIINNGIYKKDDDLDA